MDSFFFQTFILFIKCAPFLLKIGKDLTWIIIRNWGQMTSKLNIQYNVENFFLRAIILSLKASQSKKICKNCKFVKYKIHSLAKLRIFKTLSYDSKDIDCHFDATFTANH